MSTTRHHGPWTHRVLVYLFTVVFGLLSYWLLGFLIEDISDWPGPDYQALEERILDPELTAEADRFEEQIAKVQREIEAQQVRQRTLRDSTQNAQTTMNQLLAFQRLSLQKNVTPTEQEKLALAESQKRFLANQSQYQQLTEELGQFQEQLRGLEGGQRLNQEQLQDARIPVDEEFEKLSRRHKLKIASVILAILTPLLMVAILLFLRKRESIYLPLVIAFGIAVAVKVMLVMHEYFPTRYFKYVLILALLAVVTKALVILVRMIAYPKREFLYKQFREAYEAFLCPACSYPIRRGPLKYLYWTRRTVKKLQISRWEATAAETPYCCPSCGTRLFEECDSCHEIRHALLSTCEHCGDTKSPTVPQPELETSDPIPDSE